MGEGVCIERLGGFLEGEGVWMGGGGYEMQNREGRSGFSFHGSEIE